MQQHPASDGKHSKIDPEDQREFIQIISDEADKLTSLIVQLLDLTRLQAGTFKIVPAGFPVVGSQSGLLERSASHEFTLPETCVPGTLKCQVQVFPSTLAELQKGLEALLREPGGCFEQSSTSNYPNVLILNYLKEADLSKLFSK